MKIDFYILTTTSKEQSQLFAAELVAKLYKNYANPIYLYTETEAEADYFDTLLWTYQNDSFLPHAIFTTTNNIPAPILIGTLPPPASHQAILFNFHQTIPDFYQASQHVIEIVFDHPSVQQLARQRYKQYRDNGHNINTIK